MKPEQEFALNALVKQERSFADVCVPELIALAAHNKHSVERLIQHLPEPWQLADKILVAVFPSFKTDVQAFYAGKGKSMTQMFEPFQLLSIDNAARLTLLNLLAKQIAK